MTKRFSLKDGQWFMYPIDQSIPDTLWVYEGEVLHRRKVAVITKMQALALSRWYSNDGMYYSYRDGNDRMQDVYVVGDIDSWFGDDGGAA